MKRGLAVIAALTAWSTAGAQESFFTESATQPAVGLGYLRTKLVYRRLDGPSGRPDADEWTVQARYTHGIRYNVSLNAEVAATSFSPDTGAADNGFADPVVFAKWRLLQIDRGPVDTTRGSLIGGAAIPAGDSRFTSDSIDPFAGWAITSITGRHGLNGSLTGHLSSGKGPAGGDRLEFGGAWLYRLSPEDWQADTRASLYSVLELTGRAGRNHGNELLLAPGLLYEARSWAAETALLFPLSDSDSPSRRKAPVRYGFAVGFRWLF